MSSDIQLNTYPEVIPKQKAITLTIQLACTKCYSSLANYCRPCMYIAIHTRPAGYICLRAWGTYAVGDDVIIPVPNLLVVSGHGRLASYMGI